MKDQPSNSLNLVEAYSQLEPEHLIICTFTLGLGYIEQKLLNEFKDKYNTKILLVSSATGVSQSFDDLYALRGVGTHYILAKVEDTPYAFHPKIFLAIDKQKGPVIFVSGCNFTYPGMCQNLDAVDMIELSHADKPTIKNLHSFLNGLSDLVIANEQKKIIADFLRLLPDGQNDHGSSTFIHNMHKAILPQMADYIAEDIEEVKIISPYYDAGMFALSEIMKLRGQPTCSILCNNNDAHVNLANLPKGVSVFTTANEVESRFLHAKVYLFRTKTKTYSAVGSANCTTPGLVNHPSAAGNWETMIVRELSSEDAEAFYESFFPVELLEKDYWKYTAPPKNDPDSSRISFEAISHPGWLELKFADTVKFEEISGQLTTKLVSGESETVPFTNITRNSQSSYLISMTTNNQNMGDRPYLVELNLFAPSIARGATWVIQKHVLMRSRSTQQLLGKIDELQRDSENGWEQFESIMAFISGNLGFVAARQRKASQKKSKTEQPSDVVFTIEGVKELDEEVLVGAHGNMPINDLVNFGKRIEDLFENGFLKIEGEDDESEEEANTQPAEKKGREKDRNKDPKPRVQTPPPPDFQLPDLRMIYQTEFIEKYNNQINELTENEAEEQFSSILSSLVFCFKLARFIHIELSHKYPELNRDPLQCFSAIAPLVNALPGWTQDVIRLYDLSQDTCKEIFEDTGLLQEFVLFICETWAEDKRDVIQFSQKVQFVGLLKQLWSQEQIAASVKALLQSSNRFIPGRRNLIMDPSITDEVVRSFWSYSGNEKSYGSIYAKCMKLKYFQKANDHHQEAFRIMKERHSTEQKLIKTHEYRIETAKVTIKKVSAEIEDLMGHSILQKVLNHSSRFPLSATQIDDDIICPRCKNRFLKSHWLTLRSGKHVLCESCSILVIPVEEFGDYNSQTVTDTTWEKELKS